MKRGVWVKLIAVSLILPVLSCNKDEENNMNEDDASVLCYVIETIDEDIVPFYYDGNNSLERVGEGSSYEEFTYDNSKLIKHEIIENNVLNEYYLIFWNESTIDSVQYYINPEDDDLQFWLTLHYTYVNGKLSEVNVNHDQMTVKFLYEWQNGNVIKLTSCYNNECGSDVYYYDDKNNIWKAIQPYYYSYDPAMISANNVVQIVQFDENNQPTGYNTYDFVYEYNDKGYPVKVIKTEDGAEEEITYYSYNCK